MPNPNTLRLNNGIAPDYNLPAQPEFAPDFGAGANRTAIHTGWWSSVGTWLGSFFRAERDVAAVGSGVSVGYDVVSDAPQKAVAVRVGGEVVFNAGADTRLTVRNLLVQGALVVDVSTQGNLPTPLVEMGEE